MTTVSNVLNLVLPHLDFYYHPHLTDKKTKLSKANSLAPGNTASELARTLAGNKAHVLPPMRHRGITYKEDSEHQNRGHYFLGDHSHYKYSSEH